MKPWTKIGSLALTIVFLTLVPGSKARMTDMETPTSLAAKIKRFAPTVLTADTTKLSPNDAPGAAKIIAAAKYLDPLYRRQIWSGNEALLKKLQADKSALGRERLHYFLINQGPWSQLDDNEPFIAGVPAKPPQANFYPDDITKEEFNSWQNGLSAAEKRKRAPPDTFM